MAIREAVKARRKDLELDNWFELHSPCTRDRIRAIANGEDHYEEKSMKKDIIEI